MEVETTKEAALALIESQISSEVIGFMTPFKARDIIKDLNKFQREATQRITSGKSITPEDVKEYAATIQRLGEFKEFIAKLSAMSDDYDSLNEFLDEDAERFHRATNKYIEDQAKGVGRKLESKEAIIAKQEAKIKYLKETIDTYEQALSIRKK